MGEFSFRHVMFEWTIIYPHFPGGASGKEPTCQFRRRKRYGFDPWIEKISWKRARQPTPVFLPGESLWTEEPPGYSSGGCKESDITEQLRMALLTSFNLNYFLKTLSPHTFPLGVRIVFIFFYDLCVCVCVGGPFY